MRFIYPLRIRHWIFSRFVAQTRLWPNTKGHAHKLLFAPTALAVLSRSDYGHRHIAWMGFYELPLTRMITKLARQEGGIMVDVGANAGYFSCLWVASSGHNTSLAFEASPRNYGMIRDNVVSAGLRERIQLFDFAIGASAGAMTFDLGPDEQTGWGGLSLAQDSNTVTVDVRKLDDVLPPDAIVQVLKIDTEGADTWVLEGARKLLTEKRVRHVFFERNEVRMKQLGIEFSAAERLLETCGYSVSPLPGQRQKDEFYAVPS
ncbi:MAG: FkbM family methyltransferase [Gloeobacteraceae cyanobacterium ES-bin-144]|nr:FkbM family methyltransferase [Verrucomicrobiales bacterium]